jgi:hypothetical protein
MSHDLQSASAVTFSPLLGPPEESIWKRYSAHQEFPLSLAASVLLHLFVAGFVFLAGLLAFSFGNAPVTPTIETVVFAGGGGSGDGTGNPNNPNMLQDRIYFQEQEGKAPQKLNPVDPQQVQADGSIRTEEKRRETMDLFENLTKGLQRSGQAGAKGQGGPGWDGGKGDGFGPGVGSSGGPGFNKGTRHLRQSRWKIYLPREDPEAFLNKLITIKAILLLPDSERAGVYQICEDLARRPVELKPIDQNGINSYNRLWYMTHDAIDAKFIATALYLKNQPRWIAIFIPHDLEQEMLRMEFNYKKLSEEELNKRNWVTSFEVDRKGEVWDVRVRSQGPKDK